MRPARREPRSPGPLAALAAAAWDTLSLTRQDAAPTMKRSTSTTATSCDALSKSDLLALADRLLDDAPDVVEQCVAFIEAESLGLWHGRARAKMSRRLKHCRLDASQCARLLQAILRRLVSGCFSEQFKDQLRLALYLDAARVYNVARSCCAYSSADHVRRYADWILRHERIKWPAS